MAIAKTQPGQQLSTGDAAAYVNDLASRVIAYARQRVGDSEFMRDCSAGRLPTDLLQLFWLNWHQYVFEINTIYSATLQRHLPFFKRNIDLLAPLTEKIADELVNPAPPGHLLIVWQQGEIFGLTKEQMLDYEMMAPCQSYLDWFRGILYEGTPAEFYACSLTEEYVGYWAQQFREGIAKQGFQSGRAMYFTLHEEADLQQHQGVMGHNDFNKMVLRRMLEQGAADTRRGYTLEGTAFKTVDLMAQFFDGVYAEYRRATAAGAQP
jgi:pyrroloquinoline quinone (PQQ) biosynthesis protein C